MEITENLATDTEVMDHFGFENENWFRIAWSSLTKDEKLMVTKQVGTALAEENTQ